MQFQFPVHLIQIAIMLLTGDPEKVASLMQSLNNIKPSADVNSYLDEITKGKKQTSEIVETTQVAQFFAQIFQMRWLQSNPMPIERFVSIIEATIRGAVPGLIVTAEQSSRFKILLIETLNGKTPFGLTFKANKVLTQHERNFIQVSIVSDLRPVFAEDEVTEHPLGALISHNLKIDYMEGLIRKEFYVGLDEHELSEMCDALTRAEQKAKSLRLIMKNANVSYLKVESVGAEQEEGN